MCVVYYGHALIIKLTMILYVKEHCAFSKRALEAVDALKVPVTIKYKSEEGVIDELVGTGGKQQFPCLVCDDGTVLYESMDIVAYLCKEYGGNVEDFSSEIKHVCPV